MKYETREPLFPAASTLEFAIKSQGIYILTRKTFKITHLCGQMCTLQGRVHVIYVRVWVAIELAFSLLALPWVNTALSNSLGPRVHCVSSVFFMLPLSQWISVLRENRLGAIKLALLSALLGNSVELMVWSANVVAFGYPPPLICHNLDLLRGKSQEWCSLIIYSHRESI